MHDDKYIYVSECIVIGHHVSHKPVSILKGSSHMIIEVTCTGNCFVEINVV